MTPCEKKGYKVGDEFFVTEKTTFQKGARVRLSEDDGTNRPAFKGVGCKAVDGEDWHYIHLSRVRKADNDDSIITRTNGQPFATESSARQQLTAKGLQGTHKVVPHEGGYALAPKQSEGEAVTLMAGDYVNTEGMTEEQYHAVAWAFMAAGAKKGTHEPKWSVYPCLGWDARDNTLYAHQEDISKCWTGRHLTIDQVLGAANAGNATPQPEESTMTTDPIATLKQARQARDEAEKAYQEALEEAREYLGQGFCLLEKVNAEAPQVDGEDMTDPANWREGDVFECIDGEGWGSFKEGELYPLTAKWGEEVEFNGTPVCDQFYSDFKFHHRPA